jgi:small-conductance mechanosensitive channel
VRIGGDDLTLLEGLEIAAVLVAAFLISRALQRGLARTFRVRGIDDDGTLSIVQRLTHYAVMALGVLVGLGIAQIDVTTIAAAGAVFAVVVGFAMQNISENFVSGLILMIERSIKQGDILEVDGSMVRIVSMGVRATVARTLDEEELIIPNSVMVKDTVKNYTLDDRMFRLHTRVGVSYDSDMRKVRLVLERAAREVPFRSPEHEPSAQRSSVGITKRVVLFPSTPSCPSAMARGPRPEGPSGSSSTPPSPEKAWAAYSCNSNSRIRSRSASDRPCDSSR